MGCGNIKTLRFDTEDLLRILFISEDHVAAGHQFRHDLRSCLTIFPEVLAVVKVAGNHDSKSVCSLNRFEADIGSTLTDGWGDTCPVEPVGALEYLLPVDHALLDCSYRGMCAVVDNLARTCYCTCLEEVDAETVATEDAMLCPYAIAVKILYAACGNVVLRKAGHELSINAVVGK